jgi:hypothetical protein
LGNLGKLARLGHLGWACGKRWLLRGNRLNDRRGSGLLSLRGQRRPHLLDGLGALRGFG